MSGPGIARPAIRFDAASCSPPTHRRGSDLPEPRVPRASPSPQTAAHDRIRATGGHVHLPCPYFTPRPRGRGVLVCVRRPMLSWADSLAPRAPPPRGCWVGRFAPGSRQKGETLRSHPLPRTGEAGPALRGAFFTQADLADCMPLDVVGHRVIDLCVGIGALAFACRNPSEQSCRLPARELIVSKAARVRDGRDEGRPEPA